MYTYMLFVKNPVTTDIDTSLHTLALHDAFPIFPAVQAAAPAPRLAKGLETGEWELRGRGEGGGARRLCVSSLSQLLQSRHAGHACKNFTVSDAANRLVVTYECGAAGNGRTDLRVETRSAERGVGEEGVRTCSIGRSPAP